MRKIIFILVMILSSLTLLNAQKKKVSDNSDFAYFKKLNDQEKRLNEYKDNDDILKVKLKQIEIINESGKKFKAQPVKLDILASRVANKACRHAAENNYFSHWNMAGEKPYHRYAFAGGYDHISENVFSLVSTAEFDNSSESVAAMMARGHEMFMKEKAPADGHKQNIINKTHNYAGLGVYVSGGQFRYYEEFIDRYLEFSDVPEKMKPGETANIKVNTKGNGYLFYITIYREDFPEPMKVAQLKRTGSYKDYSDELYKMIPAWDLTKYRNGDEYTIPVNFSKEGLYYIHIFIDPEENSNPGAIST